MCIRLASLRSIAGLLDKYGPWNELYRARLVLVRFGIAATVTASKPPRESSTAPFHLPVTHSVIKIFPAKLACRAWPATFPEVLCMMGREPTFIQSCFHDCLLFSVS